MIDVQQRRVALLVASCFFMEMLDGTIVVTAVPRIGADLKVAPTSVGLIVSAYLITLAVLVPLSGWMVTRFGNRRIFLTAIAVFTVASLLCAVSTSLPMLVGARVLQGAGGAMMVPVGRLTVLMRADKADLLVLMSYIVWPGLVAPVVAPLAGGLLTTYADWRWIFLINVPLGLAAAIVAARMLPSLRATGAGPLDWGGVLLTCGGLGGLTFTAHLLSDPRAPWAPTVVIAVASTLLLVLTVRHLLSTAAPIVDLWTLRIRSLRLSLSGVSLFWLTVGAVPFLLPLLFQSVFGWSAVKSGAVVLNVFVGNIAIKPFTTVLLNRFGFRRVLVTSTGGVAVAMVLTALFTAETPLGVIMVITVFGGAARSLGLTAYGALSFSDVPERQMRHANSLGATVQQLCAGLGVAVATVALRAGGPLGKALTGHRSPRTPYEVSFLLLALIAAGAMALALRIPQGMGDSVRDNTAEPAEITP